MMPVAVVTGAGSGMGRAVAVRLSADGFSVALTGRTSSTLEETATLLEHPRQCLVHACDVSQEEEVVALFDRVVATFGRVDVLFNNAGIAGPRAPLESTSASEWRETLDTNVIGSFLCARQAFRVMRDQQPQGGRIINNGSIAAQVPRPHGAAYGVSKHAVTGLTRSLALEGREHSIACGQIDVGNASTALTAGSEQGALQPDGSVRPEPTFPVDDVAAAVSFMAGLSLDTNILSLTILATRMPFVGRG
jgi:NAD(P)-dependent dehydrogenase (short-subunit alcohol dehydrogenase family)